MNLQVEPRQIEIDSGYRDVGLLGRMWSSIHCICQIRKFHVALNPLDSRRRSGLVGGVLVSGLSGPGSSPGRGHCVVFLGKTLYSHSASLHPGV